MKSGGERKKREEVSVADDRAANVSLRWPGARSREEGRRGHRSGTGPLRCTELTTFGGDERHRSDRFIGANAAVNK